MSGDNAKTPVPPYGAVQLEPVQARDLDEVIRVAAASLTEHYDEAVFFTMLDAARGTFLVARDEATQRVAGFVLATRQSAVEARLLMLATRPELRRKGIGRALLRDVEQRLRTLGVLDIDLEVKEDNLEAIRFYRRAGYDLVRRMDGYYADGVAALLMHKAL